MTRTLLIFSRTLRPPAAVRLYQFLTAPCGLQGDLGVVVYHPHLAYLYYRRAACLEQDVTSLVQLNFSVVKFIDKAVSETDYIAVWCPLVVNCANHLKLTVL